MSILDALLGRRADVDDRVRNQPMPVPPYESNNKEIISIDTDEGSRDSSGRPPVVFAGGLH